MDEERKKNGQMEIDIADDDDEGGGCSPLIWAFAEILTLCSFDGHNDVQMGREMKKLMNS